MRKHGKESKKNEDAPRTPSWLQGDSERDDLWDSNQNRNAKSRSVRPKSRSGRSLQYDNSSQRGRRLENDSERASRLCKHDTRQCEQGKTGVLEGTTRHRVVKVTYEQLRQSLTDKDLHNLLSGTYVATKAVMINLEPSLVRHSEDVYLPVVQPKVKKIVKRKGAKPKKSIPPSDRYLSAISNWQASGNGNAEVVLGIYFTLYKRFFHEEDPEWIGVSSHRAITIVEEFATEITDGNYRPLINYVRKIMPLWVGQLKRGESFPDNRPTVKALFCGTRYFWSNRNLLYKRWQER